jgi:hypothetical protein
LVEAWDSNVLTLDSKSGILDSISLREFVLSTKVTSLTAGFAVEVAVTMESLIWGIYSVKEAAGSMFM